MQNVSRIDNKAILLTNLQRHCLDRYALKLPHKHCCINNVDCRLYGPSCHLTYTRCMGISFLLTLGVENKHSCFRGLLPTDYVGLFYSPLYTPPRDNISLGGLEDTEVTFQLTPKYLTNLM